MFPKKRKIYLSILSILFFLPYFGAVFFIRSDYDFIFILVSTVSFLVMCLVYLIFVIQEKDKNYKYGILFIWPAVIIVAFLFYGQILSLANYYDYHFVRKDDLIDLCIEVHNENFYTIDSRQKKVDREYVSDAPLMTEEKLLKITDKMKKYKFSYIHKRGELIYFTNSGFIDSEVGYVYNEKDEFPKISPAGRIHTWEKVGKNWYYFYAD